MVAVEPHGGSLAATDEQRLRGRTMLRADLMQLSEASMKKRMLILFACSVCALTPVHNASAAPVTLTFDEMFMVPANGLTFKGVTFAFQVDGLPSNDAVYGTNGPGGFLSEGMVLGGNAEGTLLMSFSRATPSLQFSVVLQEIGTITPGYTVFLFDESFQVTGVLPVTTESAPFFTGAIFTAPGGSISHALIDFNEDALHLGPPRFALDNLSYDVPEPGTIALLGVGLAALFLQTKKR
jgi:hypothetical protein